MARCSTHSRSYSRDHSAHSREGQAPPAQLEVIEKAGQAEHSAGSSVEAGAAAAAGPSLREGNEKEEGEEEGDDAYRVSCLEAARDLALIEALLRSSQQGGQLVEVEQVA